MAARPDRTRPTLPTATLVTAAAVGALVALNIGLWFGYRARQPALDERTRQRLRAGPDA